MMWFRPFALLLCAFIALSVIGCQSAKGVPSEQPEKRLVLNGRRFSYTGDKTDISFADDILTIEKSGEYYLSGELREGRIHIAADGVLLVLEGVEIRSTQGACIYSEASFELIAAEGKTNILSSSAKAALVSRGRLTVSGRGSLNINGEYAIIGLNDIKLNSGSLSLNAEKYGIFCRDKLTVNEGKLIIQSEDIGIFAGGGEETEGIIEIYGGYVGIKCTNTALYGENSIIIDGGTGDIRAKKVYDGKSINVKSADFPKYKENAKTD